MEDVVLQLPEIISTILLLIAIWFILGLQTKEKTIWNQLLLLVFLFTISNVFSIAWGFTHDDGVKILEHVFLLFFGMFSLIVFYRFYKILAKRTGGR